MYRFELDVSSVSKGSLQQVSIVPCGSDSLYMCCALECITFNHVVFCCMQRVVSSDSAIGAGLIFNAAHLQVITDSMQYMHPCIYILCELPELYVSIASANRYVQ